MRTILIARMVLEISVNEFWCQSLLFVIEVLMTWCACIDLMDLFGFFLLCRAICWFITFGATSLHESLETQQSVSAIVQVGLDFGSSASAKHSWLSLNLSSPITDSLWLSIMCRQLHVCMIEKACSLFRFYLILLQSESLTTWCIAFFSLDRIPQLSSSSELCPLILVTALSSSFTLSSLSPF